MAATGRIAPAAAGGRSDTGPGERLHYGCERGYVQTLEKPENACPMQRLYHHPMSSPSRYVRLILGELGESIELVEERDWERRGEFLKLNPAGTVPVLVSEHNEAVVGGIPIGEYLDETVGAMRREKRLMPESPAARAEVRRLVEWYLKKFEEEAGRYLLDERVFKQLRGNGEAPDAGVIRAGRGNLKNHMKYTGWLASSRNWLAGTRMSLADMAAASAISVLDYLGEIDWNAEPAARDWYARIKSRPAFRPLLADKVLGLPPAAHYIDLDF